MLSTDANHCPTRHKFVADRRSVVASMWYYVGVVAGTTVQGTLDENEKDAIKSYSAGNSIDYTNIPWCVIHIMCTRITWEIADLSYGRNSTYWVCIYHTKIYIILWKYMLHQSASQCPVIRHRGMLYKKLPTILLCIALLCPCYQFVVHQWDLFINIIHGCFFDTALL